jgi:hypothetical protein
MQSSEEKDFREGHFYDPSVRGFDSYFLLGDTVDLLADTVRGAVKIGDTALVGAASSIPQFLYGDAEFALLTDCLTPDSNDKGNYPAEAKLWGFKNIGDTAIRGAAYFEMRYDTLTAADTTMTKPLRAVVHDELGNVNRKRIAWDTNWENGRLTRYRIKWESDGVDFLINDTVYAHLGGPTDTSTSSVQINTSVPQALRISNRIADTTDTSSMAMKYLNVRNAKIINWRERL